MSEVTTETTTTAPVTTAPAATQQTTAPAATTATTTAPDWLSGIKNDEIRGYVQKKGFKDPEVLADSYRNLEKLMGVPKEQLLKLPEKFDSAEGEQVWQRLGKPEKPEGYGIEVAKDAPESAKEFNEWVKNAFHKSNLTSEQAKNLSTNWNEFQAAAAQKQADASLAQGKAATEALKAEWGNAYDQKMAVAKAAAQQFGLDGEIINAIEKSAGYDKTMKFLSSVGEKIGESTFVNGMPRSGNGPMDTATAKAAYAALKADPAFMARYMAGGAAEKAEFARIGADAFPGTISV